MDRPFAPTTADGVPPLYRQVLAWLVAGLEEGHWPAGAAIPPERVLSRRLGVSRATVRHAVEALEREGRLVRQQGRGTFVAREKLEQPLARLRGFTGAMRELGVVAGSRVLRARLEPADAEVAARLRLVAGAPVAVIARVRLADGVPLMVEICHLDHARVPGVLEHDLSASLYDLIARRYGVRLRLGSESLEVRRAEPWTAKALDLEPGTDLLYTERVTHDEAGAVIEFTRRWARADRFRFHVTPADARAELDLRRDAAGGGPGGSEEAPVDGG